MTYRKTWFSYVLWAVYAGICVMLLAFMGYYLYSEYISVSMAKIGGFLIFPIAIGAYWVIREVAQCVRKKYSMQKHTAQMLEAFVVALCIVFGTLYRMSGVLYSGAYFELTSTTPFGIKDIVETPYSTYFDMALVRTGEQLAPLTHGVGYLYVLCVSAACSFLGNKIMSAVLFEAAIQIISLVLSYLVVRKTAGKLPACVVLIYLSFSSIYVNEMYSIAPDNLVFMLYLIGLLLIITYVRDYCDNRFSKPMAVCGAVLVGIVTGILVYLDIKFLVLLVFLIGLFTGKKEHKDGGQVNNTAKVSIVSFIVILVSCAAGSSVMFGIAALYRGSTFIREGSSWLELYQQKCSFSLFYSRAQGMPELPVVTLLVAAGSFLVFEFLRDKLSRGKFFGEKRENKEQNYMLWILACILIAPTPLFSYGILPYTMIALFQWSVLAGLGLQNCIFGGQAKVVQAKIEEINASVEPIEEKRSMQTAQKVFAEVKPVQKVENMLAEEKAAKDADKMPTEETLPETVEKPRFIENPLPLPKKHVKKEMDYQYPVADKDMKYDIEVDENDDFDIQ